MALRGHTPTLGPRLDDIQPDGASRVLWLVTNSGTADGWACAVVTVRLTTTPGFITEETRQLRPEVLGTAGLSTTFHTSGVFKNPAPSRSVEEQDVLPTGKIFLCQCSEPLLALWPFSYSKANEIIFFIPCPLWGKRPVFWVPLGHE